MRIITIICLALLLAALALPKMTTAAELQTQIGGAAIGLASEIVPAAPPRRAAIGIGTSFDAVIFNLATLRPLDESVILSMGQTADLNDGVISSTGLQTENLRFGYWRRE